MIILDYVRELRGTSEIVIPPFHTGHLGFVPETEVHVGLLGGFEPEPAHYEVLIAPFKLNHMMARVSCTMRDEPGVVKRLVDAISKFNINIATKESSSLHRSKYHRVNLILDWNTAHCDPKKPATARDRERYRRFERNFPTSFHKEIDVDDEAALLEIGALVANAQAARIRPKVFLSYPTEAKRMANHIRQRFVDQFEFRDYFEGDNKKICDEVIRRIRSCDAFIGLWHPASQKSRGEKIRSRKIRANSSVSIWLPFEFGIAKDAAKLTMRCRHRGLESAVCLKIEGEIAIPVYDERAYDECLNQIGKFLNTLLQQEATQP